MEKTLKQLETYILKLFYECEKASIGRISPRVSEQIEDELKRTIKNKDFLKLALDVNFNIIKNISDCRAWFGNNLIYLCYTTNFETVQKEYYRQCEVLKQKLKNLTQPTAIKK